jgi:hypothetical protein
MITDHAQLNQKAAQLQHAQNVIPTRSDVSDQVFTANQDAMGGTENAREYINREVTAHQNLLNTLDTKLIPNARDTSLRRMLTEARGVVQNHLAQAQRLQSGQQTASASVAAANSELSVSASRDSLSANAHATSQPRPDTIRANSNSTMYQATTPSVTTTTNAAPAQHATVSASASASATPPSASVSSTTNLNPSSAQPTPASQQLAVAPAPTTTNTTTSTAANPCDNNTNRAINAAPGISPNNMMAPKTDTTRGYDSRVTTTPAPVRPDTIRVRSDSLRVRIDTGTTRQPQPAPGKP